MDLKVVHENLRDAVLEQLLLAAAAEDIGDLAAPLEELTSLFEGLGLCHLLEDLNIDEYRINLTRAAHARRHFLRKCRAAGVVDDRRLALSRTDAVLDALAIGSVGLARDIADLSDAAWNPGWEYRDDYCYFSLLHQFCGAAGTKPPADLIDEFDAALEGQLSSRLDVCRALLSADSDLFAAAWSELMDEARRQSDENRARMVEPDLPSFLFWPRAFVNVEGLALLRIAEMRGLHVDVTHPICPEPARHVAPGPAVPDLFEEMEAAKQ